MRVLVTGAQGFVGQVLVPRLRRRFPEAIILPGVADIADAGLVDDAMASHRPDICIHLAAISTIGGAACDPDRAWRVNLDGTRHIAQSLLRHAPDCLLIFASTAEAYGASFRPGAALSESAALAPANIYAATKACADLALGAYAGQGLRVVRMRPFNHTGPLQSESFVVPAFAGQIARIALGRQPPEIHVGNLDAERDFLDVRDVCDAYLDVIAHAREIEAGTIEAGAIFNICSGITRPIRSVLDDLIALGGVKARIVPDPARMRPSDIPRAAGDAGRVREVLRWSPRVPWRDTLADIYRDALSREGATGPSAPSAS